MALGGLAQAFVRLRIDSSQVAADTNKGIEEGAAGSDAEKAGETTGERYSSGFNKAFKAAAIGALVFAALGAASIKMGIDFQASMLKIQTQAGGSAADVKQLSAAVLNLAPSTEQGPLQLADALFHLKSVGLDNVQAMQALKTASDLAAVGGANLEDTTNAIAAAWRSGISGAQNFGQAAATVNAIIGAGNMRMADFVTAMGTGVLSAATTFGVSLKQVGGALALMTDEGVPAVDAATRLKMSFSLLGAPSKAAAAQLKTIGLTGLQLANTMRGPTGLVGTIGLLKSHLDAAGLSASQQAILLSHAFGGGRSSSAILTMINNLSTLEKKQGQITAGISKYGPAVAAQRQTVQAQLDILRSSLETIGVRTGTALLGPAIKFVHFISGSLIPGILSIGGILGGVLKNPFGGAFIAGLLAAVVGIKVLITVTKLWGDALKAVKLAMAFAQANPLGLVIIAVAALAIGLVVLYKRSAAFRNIVQSIGRVAAAAFGAVVRVAKTVFDAVIGAGEKVIDWLKGHWKLIAVIIAAPFLLAIAPIALFALAIYKLIGPVEHVFDTIKKIITGGFDSWWKGHGKEIEEVWKATWEAVTKVFSVFWAVTLFEVKQFVAGFKVALAILTAIWDLVVIGVRTGWNVIMGILRPGLDLVMTLFRAGWGYISATTRATWDLISGICKSAWAVISGVVKIGIAGIESVIKIAWDIIVGIFTVALDLLTGKWGKAWDDMQNTATQVWNAIKGFFTTTVSDIEHIFSAAWNALLGGVKSWGSNLVGYVKTIPGMIIAALGDVAHMLWNAGVSIIKGLLGGIKSAIGGIGHIMGNVVGAIKSFLPFSPAKQGPLSGSGDPYYSGLSIGNKIAAGIRAALPAVKAAIAQTVASIPSQLATAATTAASSATSSDDTSSSDSSSTVQTPNFAALNQWLAATAPDDGASGGSWRANPGPLGGYGVGVADLSGPGLAGRWTAPGGGGAQDDVVAHLQLLGAKLDELVEVGHQAPSRTAAGLNAAMNGVTANAVVRGNW